MYSVYVYKDGCPGQSPESHKMVVVVYKEVACLTPTVKLLMSVKLLSPRNGRWEEIQVSDNNHSSDTA